MTALYLVPPAVAFVLLAAHFYRGENYAAALVSLLVIALIFVRRPWAARAIQVALLVGSIEWARTAVSLVLARQEMGEPFLRLAIILGGVSLFTALAALVFQTSRVRAHYKFGSVSGAL